MRQLALQSSILVAGIWKAMSSRRRILLIGLAILLVAGGCVAYWFFSTRNDSNSVEVIVDRVSRHMMLPGDEEPALLTITDSSKLTTQFLKQAENGDKVLIYKVNQKAIIYRPAVDKIVDVGPVVIDTPQQADQ